jgi:hypothetical protein
VYVSATRGTYRFRLSKEPSELTDIVTLLLRSLERDLSRSHQIREALIHGLHPEPTSGLHRRVDLMDLSLPDEVPDGRRGHKDLAGRCSTCSIRSG